VDAATRSGAVVYSLDSRGLVTGGRDASSTAGYQGGNLEGKVQRRADQIAQNTLNTLAEQTGGFLVKNMNDLASGLQRMLEDNATYYALAYQPINTKADGRFRRLQVKLPRHPKYNVRTRRGYYAPDPRRAALEATRLNEGGARALLDQVAPGSNTPSVRLIADYVDLPPAGAQVLVRASVDLSAASWEKVDGKQFAVIDVAGAAYDSAGKMVGEPFVKRQELHLTGDEWKRAKQEGFRYQSVLALAPGAYEIRLLARDPRGKPLGGATRAVEVPDLGARRLALSSVFLSSAAPQAAAGTQAAEQALNDAQLTRRFKRGDAVFFQVYVYNPLADEAGKTDVILQAQIRQGEKAIAASKPQPVVFQQKDGAPVPQSNGMSLEGLPPGAYVLRIVAFDQKAKVNATRDIDFTLE
jgi:hypothetical protein